MEAINPKESVLAVRSLIKEYKEGLRAVDGVSFEVKAGEIFGLLGPNGAGKTTIIRAISTILSFTSGEIEVAGMDNRKEAKEVRSNIGVLTTDIGAYDRFTGRENLKYFGELYGMKKEALEKRIGELSELLDMKDFLDKRAGEYSTGMKQCLAIARSVFMIPRLLFLMTDFGSGRAGVADSAQFHAAVQEFGAGGDIFSTLRCMTRKNYATACASSTRER
jgi:sodium transport system ATP-binding protein